MSAHQACKSVRVAKRDGDKAEIDEQRDEREHNSDRIDQDQKRGQQRRAGDERHAKRNDAEFVAAAAIARAKSHELAHGQAKQNQTARDLKIFHRDSERVENNFAEENETDGNAQARENSEHRLMLAIFGRRARAKPAKIATRPIGSIATKSGINASKNFSRYGCTVMLFARRAHVRKGAILLYRVIVLHNLRPSTLSLMKRLFTSLLLLCLAAPLFAAETKSIDDFQAAAAKKNSVLTIPDWPQTPEAVDTMTKDAIAKANAALDEIGKQDLSKVTFKSTIVALDDLAYEATISANKASIIKESNTSAAMREAGENAVKAFQEFAVAIDYREDVYKAMKAFADTHPKLSGEDEKLFKETMRDYPPRRIWICRPRNAKRSKNCARNFQKLGTDFDANIVNAKGPVVFTKAELDGVPESFLASPGVKTGDDAYTVMANITWQFITVEENAKSEATRKKLYLVHDSLAKDTNAPVLNQMLALRNKIALRLGYKSWDDYQTEIKMAKTGAGAKSYIDNLISRHPAEVRGGSFRDAENESRGDE